MDAEEAGPSSAANAAGPTETPANGKPVKKVKKHATVYQKNALYGAYRFWRKKNEDLKARGVDVGFEWKELFEFFGFAKTTGFKVIKDADADPSTLLRKDETGRVETRGRKPKMSEEQIQAVEKMLDGQDPFQEGIEWKVIAKNLDLDVHKHTVRRTIRRNMQSKRKSSTTTTPSRPAATPANIPNNMVNLNTNAPSSSNPRTLQAPIPAPVAPNMQRLHLEVNGQMMPPHSSISSHPPTMSPHPQALAQMPTNVDPRIMAMSAQPMSHGPYHSHSEADMARLLSNAQ